MTIHELNHDIHKLEISIFKLRRKRRKAVRKRIEQIIAVIELQYGLSKGSIYRKTRKRIIVEARQMSMFLINLDIGLTFRKTGGLFNLDHSSAVYAKKTMLNFFETNTVIHNNIIEVCNKLKINQMFIKQMITKT